MCCILSVGPLLVPRTLKYKSKSKVQLEYICQQASSVSDFFHKSEPNACDGSSESIVHVGNVSDIWYVSVLSYVLSDGPLLVLRIL